MKYVINQSYKWNRWYVKLKQKVRLIFKNDLVRFLNEEYKNCIAVVIKKTGKKLVFFVDIL